MEYQTESKRNETFVRIVLEQTHPGDLEWTSRKQQGGHEAGRCAPHPHGPLVAPLTDFFCLYIFTYPENIQEHHETLFLGAFSGAPPEGELIMEGIYINTIASPMSCE